VERSLGLVAVGARSSCFFLGEKFEYSATKAQRPKDLPDGRQAGEININ